MLDRYTLNMLRTSGKYADERAYWLEKLSGDCVMGVFPYDHLRQPDLSYLPVTRTGRIEGETFANLHRLSGGSPTGLFMTLLLGVSYLLYRYTSNEDLLVGMPAFRSNSEPASGNQPFYALRTAINRTGTGRDLLLQIRDVVSEARKHRHISYEVIQDQLASKGEESPLFNTVVSLKGLHEEFDLQAAAADSVFCFELQDGAVELSYTYNASLYTEETAEQIQRHLFHLLSLLTNDMNRELSSLDILTEEDRQRILIDFNDSGLDYPHDKVLYQFFMEQAQKTPDNIAVIFEQERLTYRELDERSNQVARYLIEQGVQIAELVGVVAKRCLNTVVHIIGILKSGAAYVPIDPDYPEDRKAYILENSQSRILLQPDAYESLELARYDADDVGVPMDAERLAYVMYTSGSTGMPKGVAMTHRSALNTVLDCNRILNLTENDRVLSVASFCFDLTVVDMFGTLGVGGAVVLIPKQKDVRRIVEIAIEHEITVWNSVPSVVELGLLYLQEGYRNTTVRNFMLSGDFIPLDLLGKVREFFPEAKLFSFGGCTEVGIWSLYFPIEQIEPEWTNIPYGYPLSNQQIYVLNKDLQPCPLEVEGELYFAGDGLAIGYYRDEVRTREAFIDHPEFGRLYNTGDYSILKRQGYIKLLGRKDFQVKIRGFRVEMHEVRLALLKHEGVREAVITARNHANILGHKFLCAYVTAEPGVTMRSLREHMGERLPEFMVPSYFVIMDEIPLSANGKVDIKALPAPELSSEPETVFKAPRTEVEVALADAWKDVLGLEKVGVDDNFFALGGDSIKALRVIAKLSSAFTVEIKSVFEQQTIAGLAALLEGDQAQTSARSGHEIQVISHAEPLPLSFAQQRLWVLEQLVPGTDAYNMPMAARLIGDLRIDALEYSLNEVLQRHEALRTTFADVQGQPVQIIAPMSPMQLAAEDLRAEADRHQLALRLVQEEAQRPFDLRTGPLFRARLMQVEDQEHVLVLNMHHIISDGWSIGVLIREVTALYEAFVQGAPSPLTDLPVQYADYAAWQREWLQGDVLEGQLSYWREQLGGELPALQVPTDRPRPPVQTYRGGTERFTISKSLVDALQAIGQRYGATQFMTLLGAFQTLLYRYSGQEDFTVGTPMAGRVHEETEGLIGFFVNTLVMRTDLSDDPTFVDLLSRVRDMSIGAFANQDVPFEKLVEELQPERDTSRTPLFQVMFVLQNTPVAEAHFSGLTLVPIDADNQAAKFDLVLTLEEQTDGMLGVFQYNSDLFDAATIQRMSQHFENLLMAMTADPMQKVAEVPLLTSSEEQVLLVDWNQTDADFPRTVTMHHLFEAQVERTPEAIALVVGEQRLTYRELNARANQVAYYLRRLGVQQESLVGVYLQRSVEMVVGMLGILKAGGAYVPLDPAYPQERILYTMEDAEATVLLTQSDLQEQLPSSLKTVCLDTEWASIAQEAEQNPSFAQETSATHLAYVIYTSGSTGRPKGVAIEHQSAVAMINWAQGEYSQQDLEGVLFSTSICFDLSVYELFVTLSSGGKLILAENALHLPQLPAKDEVTLINTVPSAIAELLRIGGLPTTVRTV
ncbi:non-ribosomal peptide synthetase, partial [Tumebacillus permanentifrigoris]